MAYTDIDKPSDYFNTKLYNGTGSSNAITNVGFRPDFTWIKRRNSATAHHLHNSISGATKVLNSNTSNAESTDAQKLSSFDSDGFTVGTNGDANNSAGTFASWNWLAGGTASSNTDGSITTTVSASQTSGFSIIKYAGNSSNSTIGHGLGAEPEFLIFKEIDGGESWRVWSKYTPNTSSNALALNLSDGAFSQSGWISAVSTSTISIGTDSSINTNGNNYICYAFAPKKGFSSAGQYQGNGSNSGPYIHLGFKPAFVIIKPSSYSNSWLILDNKRPGYNVTNQRFEADGNGAEYSGLDYADFLSNGFKIRTSNSHPNTSGGTLIYMSFAESPFVTSTGIPTTAR